MKESVKIIHSQIGYDIGKNKRAFATSCPEGAHFVLTNAITKVRAYEGEFVLWGEKWGERWFVADFTSLDTAGKYTLEIFSDDEPLTTTDSCINIGYQTLWNSLWYPISLSQLDVRASSSYPEGGWRDCGSELQEVSSHIIMLDGMCDLLCDSRVPECEKPRIIEHIIRGAEYIILCQTADGGFVHEYHQNPSVSFENCANAVAVLSRASMLLRKENEAFSLRALAAAERGFDFVMTFEPSPAINENDSFVITHGAPSTSPLPKEFRTRELLAFLSAVISLYKCGKSNLKHIAFELVNKILARQIKESNAEYGFFGHFLTYPDCGYSEKANYHCGAWDAPYKNYNQGAHKPFNLLPLIDMITLFPDHPNQTKWKTAVHSFAYNFFKPACQSSPFMILPCGIYQGEGLLYFSGWYHGHAKIYGYAAVIAKKFYELWQDSDFLDIAVANIQWIAGLNPFCISLAVGIGEHSVTDWNNLRGTVINGPDASPQFTLRPVSLETDLPSFLDNEGGIHHCAGLLSGICAIK